MTTTDRHWWAGRREATPEPRFSGCTRRSLHVPARDGTRLAIDVYLPDGLPPGERVPTILVPTPYFRSMEFRSPIFEKLVAKLSIVGGAEFAGEITKYGYANVVLELRGAGASFGRKDGAMKEQGTVADGADVLDWIAAQPWSNGNVGATGISGPGMLSQWMTTAKHPALKAIAPRFTSFDMFASTHPGGLTLGRFLLDIGSMLRAMDSNHLAKMSENPVARVLLGLLIKGLMPVDGPDGRRLLDEAVKEHEGNEHIDEQLIRVLHRDELLPGASTDITLDKLSPFADIVDMEASGVAIYAWAGWYDAAFARDMLSLHNTVRNEGSRIVIGPWSHGGRWHSSPLAAKKQATDFDHVAEMVRFFDLHLRDRDADVSGEAPIHYFTMGEERWKTADQWPPPGTSTRTLYLASGNTLGEELPAYAGVDTHVVDFDAATGVHSRFGKHMTGGRFAVTYPDRAAADARLLTYTSAPLTADTEVTGHPQVQLFLSSTATDGAVLVYLEDVGPDGQVLNVTDGCLRASARATADAPYWFDGPFHPYAQADPAPLVPGEVTELAFDLFPVSWLFRAGHRIRVAISGADKDNFVPVAQDQSPVLEVHSGPSFPSRIELPVVPR